MIIAFSICRGENVTDQEINKKKVESIKQYQSNNPKIGYNRFPKFKTEDKR